MLLLSIKEWNNLAKDLKELKNAKALKKKVINNLLTGGKQNSNEFFIIRKTHYLLTNKILCDN